MIYRSVYIQQNSTCSSFSNSGSWTILSNAEQSIKAKIERLGTPLKQWDIRINRGILTGYNEAFIISTEKKEELIADDPRSAEIIRPILRGRDIKRYEYTFAQLWLIATFPSRKYNIDNYPAVKQHLLSFGIERLEQTGKVHMIAGEKIKARKKTNNKWFETQDSINYWNDFFQRKIVYREISDVMDACLVEPGILLNNKCYLITGEHLEYLLAFFNSKVFTKIILPQANITGGKGESFLSAISSLYPTEETEAKIHHLLQERSTCSAEEAVHVDKEIDELFFSLYGLNANEVSFLNGG